MMRHAVCWTARLLLGLVVAGCAGEPPAGPPADLRGPSEGAAAVAEDTTIRCRDGRDNDGDGKVDCADPGCGDFYFCRDSAVPGPDAPAPDVATVDQAAGDLAGEGGSTPDAALLDLPAPDALAVDAPWTPDAPLPDQLQPDLVAPDTGVPCAVHCDCPQGSFCYLGKCIVDPKMPVYCCHKGGCPPGWWCVDKHGKKATCAPDPNYKCSDACDCGPAHCCKGGACVKNAVDPWRPGGKVSGGASCTEGQDATYCCDAPECDAGRFAYGPAADDHFRCHDKSKGQVRSVCGSKSCFGTACNCAAGEACVDTVNPVPPGRTCLLLSGGSCVSTAAAAALYGFQPSDLLACCAAGCLKGTKCDAGWRSDAKFGYVRVEATCGTCGNGICDAGEYPMTCPKDCACGDGVCAPAEVGSCPKDCKTCNNGVCEHWESPSTCKADCAACGDGWCSAGETALGCPKDCAGRCPDTAAYSGAYRVCGDGVCTSSGCADPETCLTCPQDCGACQAWQQVRRVPAWTNNDLHGIWGKSLSSLFVVGASGTILRYDGSKWKAQWSGTNSHLFGVWGSSASDVHVVGQGGTIAHYDGKRWTQQSSGVKQWLYAVWGTSASNVVAAGTSGTVLRFDGKSWSKMASGTKSHLYGLWGSSASDVHAVGADLATLHYDGKQWTSKLAYSTWGPKTVLRGIWGVSGSQVYAVGHGGWYTQHASRGVTLAYKGKYWTTVNADFEAKYAVTVSSFGMFFKGAYNKVVRTGTYTQWTTDKLNIDGSIYALWPGPKGQIVAVGSGGWIIKFSPAWFGFWEGMNSGGSRRITDLWGASATDLYVTESPGHVLHYDGAKWSRVCPGASSTEPRGYYTGLWASSATDIYAVGDGTKVCHFDGVNWAYLSQYNFYLDAVWGSSPNNVLAVGSDGVYRSAGASWSKLGLGPTHAAERYNDLWGASATNIFVVGSYSRLVGGHYVYDGRIIRSDGKHWFTMPLGQVDVLRGVWGSSGTNVFAVGGSGTILRYDGTWWVKMNSGAKANLAGIGGTSATDVVAVGRAGAVLSYQAGQWKRVRLDLRQPTSNAYVCPNLDRVRTTASGDLFIVGSQETLLRRCPKGGCK